MCPKDFLQIIERVEHMDPDSSIEASRLEKPKILMLVLRGSNLILSPDDLVVLLLQRLQPLI